MTSASSPSAASASPLAQPQTQSQSSAAKRAELKLQDMKGALATLKTVQIAASSQQKSAAKARLDALKERLKMLRMMSGGDPKALARAAAQLAKEVAQAAKDYAAAGGSPADAGPPVSADPPPAEDQDKAQASDSQAAPADGSQPSADKDKVDAPGETAKSDAPKTQAQAVVPGLQAPDPAMDEAKQLAAGARALLEAAIARAKREHHAKPDDFRDELAAMKDADKDIDKAARKVADDEAPAAYGPTGQGIAAPAPGAPVASLKT